MNSRRPAPAGRDLLLAMAVFAAINFGLVALNGVRYGGDTPLYLEGAARLIDGRPLVDRQPSYTGYVAVVAAAQALGIGTSGVVAIQVLFGAAIAALVFKLGAALAGRPAGMIAAALYSVDVGTNRWHQFILADSIYVSAFVAAVWLTHRPTITRGIEPPLSALSVTVAAALVRPEGWFLLPAVIGYLIVMRPWSVQQKLASAGATAVVVAVLLWALSSNYHGNMQAVGPASMLQRGQTIWDYDGWRVAMPAGEASPGGQAVGAIDYALRHPVSTIKLMVARVAVHFAHVRPFYSTPHNVVIVLWLVPLYAAALWALRRSGLTPLPVWIVAAIATQTAVVALTHAEWDGRYLAHVLPLIDPLAGAGAVMAFGQPAAIQGAHAHG